MRRGFDREWLVVVAALAVAGVGWGVHATLLALVGVLGALTAALLWIWQRECLTGVTYERTLSQHRATFGEEITLDAVLVNDKLLPLTWLHVTDEVPRELTIRGGTVLSAHNDLRGELHQLLPILPYQRIRRRVTVVCDRRGDHTFGPIRIRSGNPIGYREAQITVRDQCQLLVYPKVLRLARPEVASLVPLGNQRAALDLVGDPSRPAGVREYRPGDPLRHVDWRATARSSSLLVRVFEPTSAPRVAVFADTNIRRTGDLVVDRDVAEFTIALTASLVADLLGRGVATGLYSSARVAGAPIVHEPSSSPTALPTMLELLARCTPWSPGTLGELLIGEAARLRRGASVLVVANNFRPSLQIAVAEVRRRLPVTALWVATEAGHGPPPGLADRVWEVSYASDWATRDALDLAA